MSLQFVMWFCMLWNGVEMFPGIPDFLEWGYCADLRPPADINYYKFSGRWFMQENVPNEFSVGKKCNAIDFTWDGVMMRGSTAAVNKHNQFVQTPSTMTLKNVSGNNPILYVKPDNSDEAPFVIFETDYANYACVYSCLQYFGFRAEFTWTFTRNVTYDVNMIHKCHSTLIQHDVTTSKIERVYQGKECPDIKSYDIKNQPHLQADISAAKLSQKESTLGNVANRPNLPYALTFVLLGILCSL